MKKFTLLLCVTVAALCLPQNLVAATTVNLTAGVLTINTTEAGTLTGNTDISNIGDKGSVTSIILNGKFNSDDLGAISSNNGFNSVTTVDMSNAKFMGTTNSSYMVFSAESDRMEYPTNGLSTNDKSVVGDLYISGDQETRTWANVNDEYDVANKTFQNISFSEEDRDSHKGDFNPSENIYIRFLQGTFYYQLTETRTWTDVTSSLDDDTKNGITLTFDSEDLMNQDVNATNGNYAKVVAGYSYYLVEVVNYNRVATPVDFSNIPQYAKIVEQSGVNPDVYGTNVEEGCYIRTYSGFNYYQLATSNRHWESVNSLPEGKTAKTPSFTEANMNSCLDYPRDAGNSLILVGDYIVFDRYNYYKLVVATELGWIHHSPVEYEQPYDLGDRIYTNSTDLESNSPDQANLYAVVGGSVKMWNGTEWSTDTEVYDWTQMKFSYWQNVVNAVTSKYADSNISGDIFSGCNSIQTVDFKAGVVKGLTGKTTLQTLNVGRDVTEIASAALKESGVQTVTFDKNYTAEEKALATAYYNNQSLERPVYPKDLTIGEDAFLQCSNLSQIEFPNRVISIGNSAFKQAGTSASELKVTFERRITSGTTSTSSIDYDHDLTIATSAFYGCTTLKNIDLPIRLSSLGYDAFKLTSGLESVTMREDLEDSRLTTIPSGAFQESGLKSVKIPKSVTLIESNAFGSCYELTEIEFQESNKNPQPTLTIKTGAFAGGTETSYKLRTVKVDFTHEQRLTVCEFNAFNFTSLVGQTDVTSGQIATLEFPESDWNFYIGDWKKGLAFSQSNLNSFKDGYEGIRAEQEPTEASGGVVSTLKPANGWQQFAKTKTNT